MTRTEPQWARWPAGARDWTLGVEEEVMLVDPADRRLANAADEVLEAISPELAPHVSPETHAGALELATGIHETAAGAVRELGALRARLAAELAPLGFVAAVAGTHPLTRPEDVEVARGHRQRLVHESMRELARREPTFALHVHVGVADPETAIDVANRLRAHVPVLLALSANSPFWRGSDSGLASARVPLFQSFPRVGIPRRFDGYDAWIAAVVPLVDSGAIPDPTYLWWDVRLQPRFGTVEVRIMDAQTSLRDVAALVAFVPAVARLEAVERYAPEALLDATEVLDENRFLAARDGVDARLIDPVAGERVPVRALVARLVAAARPHAAELGGERTLDLVDELVASPPARRQRTRALGPAGLAGVVGSACAAFARGGAPGQPAGVGSSDAAG